MEPKHVQVLRFFGKRPKKKMFGSVVATDTSGGTQVRDKLGGGITKPGEVSFYVMLDSPNYGASGWFSHDGIRFTKAPTMDVAQLSSEEKVALDALLENGNGHREERISALVPSRERRRHVKGLAAQLRSLRPR